MQKIRLTPHEVDEVARFMRQESGNDFSDKRTLVAAKMGTLCGSAGYRHFWELWDAAKGTGIASAQLRQQIVDELTTNYSFFYRESAHFDALGALISSGEVPVRAGGLRVWSAGCATGEEAYNLAMAIEDARRSTSFLGEYHIVGSDISSRAIGVASRARYDVANVARMPPHWRNLYCVQDGQGYQIREVVRRHVTFRRESVLAPRPDMPYDVVVCRNMIIYFDQESIERFVAVLRGRVAAGGYLFLGHTEIMGSIDGFAYVAPSIWRRDAG